MIGRALHILVRCLPVRARREVLPYILGRFAARLIVKHRKLRAGPITVAGFLRSTVGLGQGARLSYTAFNEIDREVNHVDVAEIFYWHKNIDVDLGPRASPGEGGSIIIHLNPLELSMVLPLLGRKLIKHKKIIGYWAWELEALPSSWRSGFKLVDEVWVPSVFVADVLRRYTDIPVRVVHHPVRRPILSSHDRRYLGLKEAAFIVLTMFDMRSSAERKNPIGAIRAFKRAFGDRDDVLLVIKIGNSSESSSVMARIEEEIDGAKNIQLMFDKLSQIDQADLINSSDVVMSLHRSEGFGLVMAEAMLLGKAVIATAYSGNMDFMDSTSAALIDYKLITIDDPQGIYNSEDGAYWAEPNIDEAADWLIRLAGDVEMRKLLGGRARRKAEDIFSLDAFESAIGNEGRVVEKVPLANITN